jgi:hypothetical protein
VQQYQNALAVSTDETTQAKLNDATGKCTPPTEKAAPTDHPEPTSESPTEEPSVVVPTDEPTVAPPEETPVVEPT